MVHGTSYNIVYKIEFINPIDQFVILQKQIDSRFNFIKTTETSIVIKIHNNIFDPSVSSVSSVSSELENHKKICNKYHKIINKLNFDNVLFLKLCDDPKKYEKIRYIYNVNTNKQLIVGAKNIDELNNIIDAHIEKNKLDYEETVNELELFLEEFKLFVNSLKLEKLEQNAINLIIQDPKLSSNIKFAGWKDIIEHW
jgi:hypothetical protein